jgi:predicted kinase
MQLILFVGIQGCGKSTFYARQFASSHVRINLDMLKTRHRERLIFNACLDSLQPTVIDNTNPTPEERAQYIVPAKERGFEIVGYYFQSRIEDCKRRNEQRSHDQAVPLVGLLGTARRLVLPSREEGFDKLSYVRIDDTGQYVVEEWCDEVR